MKPDGKDKPIRRPDPAPLATDASRTVRPIPKSELDRWLESKDLEPPK